MSSLQLNVSKTKEMCCAANNVRAHCKPLLVNEQVGFFLNIRATEIDSQF